MATHVTKLTVRVAWWLKLYFYVLAGFAATTGREPNWERVNNVIRAGVTVNDDRAESRRTAIIDTLCGVMLVAAYGLFFYLIFYMADAS